MSGKSTGKKDDKKLAKTVDEKTDKKSLAKDSGKKAAAKDTGRKNPKKSSAKDSSKKSFHPFKSFGKFIREYRSELKKISWPAPKDTTKNALITLAAILIVGIFIWLLDYGLSELRDVAINKIPEWSVSSDAEDEAPITSDSSLIVSGGDSAE